MTRLPIEPALPALLEALALHGTAVLQAPPGAGKTTRVPLALLGAPWRAGRKVVMLEPRRIAARAAAQRMAASLGERVGDTVGYRVRMESRVGPGTRVEVVTEGILTRMLQRDPALEEVALVIFDEFHERSLHADLGLALALQSRAILREDLRLLVMSATLDGAAVAELLGGAPVITSEGRAFPVETRYRPPRSGGRLEPAVADAVLHALEEEDGDLLVFLPGAGEIRRVQSLLADAGPPVSILPLYGALPRDAQDRAITPGRGGERRVVLATAIAETSLTIEGVRVVVDSGVARVPRFSPRRGMTTLETVRVSRASADQRRGRAGRLGPGVCYRLWPEHTPLLAHGTPEILEADLAPLALELASAGVSTPADLEWLDPPPTAAFSQARELLGHLGAVDGAGRITPHGRRMGELGLHPRLAHMLLEGERLGLGGLACDVAALLGERDILRGEGEPPEADLRFRLDALRSDGRSRPPAGHTVDRDALRRVRAEAHHRRERMRVPGGAAEAGVDECGLLVALAYPERIAARRAGERGRFLLRGGRGASLSRPQPLADAPYLAVADLDGSGRDSRIYLAAPLATAELEEHFGAQIITEDVVRWDADAAVVRARRQSRLGALVLKDAPLRDPDPAEIARTLLEAIGRSGISALPWSPAAAALRQRIAFLHTVDAAWPDWSDAALAANVATWLGPHLHGIDSLAGLRRLDLAGVLLSGLTWQQRAALDEMAPSHVTVPSGSVVPIDYTDPAAPVLAVRLQEMFGLSETPRIARGTVPLTLHLLSPARRPVQVTRDLGGFWSHTYFEVKKDLKGRYPKHFWPDDPRAAAPTHRAKPRR